MLTSLTNARLQWDEHGMPFSLDYGDIYYSKADALGESSHVFLAGNALQQRFAGLQRSQFTIGELGFGAGLNFLNSCRLWCAQAPAAATLHYLACELHPFSKDDLARLLGQFPLLQPFSGPLLDCYPDHTAGVHQLTLTFNRQRVMLTLLYGDALTTLTDHTGNVAPFAVDAWFLDGFAPKVNHALWQQPILQLLARCSHSHTTFATYSVAGSLRRTLASAGFAVEKRKGYTGKRHMLVGRASGGTAKVPVVEPLRRVCVIGGGLAGCSTAYALAISGWQVTLLDKAATLASAGSGNLHAILHCKPATAQTPENHFNLHGYLHAANYYCVLQQLGLPWQRCGMLQLATNAEQLRRFEKLQHSGRFSAAIVQQLTAKAASELAGVPLQHPALYFPLSGWLNPAELCHFYVQHPNISVHTGTAACALERTQQGWLVQQAPACAQHFGAVVLCNAGDLFDFPQCRHLPLICNRGQVDVYAGSPAGNLQTIVCGQGYVTPADHGNQSLGGSYFVEGTSEDRNRLLHLQLLQRMSPELAEAFSKQQPVQQRVAQRCQTPDRMPLVGELNALLPGLYINAGHGSNGLARTPISAALIASLLNHTPAPLPQSLRTLLSPTRFLL